MRVSIFAVAVALAVGSAGACADLSDESELDAVTDETTEATPSPTESVIVGTYTGRVPKKDFAGSPYEGAYEGNWRLTFEEDGFFRMELLRLGGVAEGRWRLEGDVLTLTEVPAPKGTWNCYEGGERLLDRAVATYRVDLESEELTLSAEEDPCDTRPKILEREWTTE